MRVLIVSVTDHLAACLSVIDTPALDICAFVVDDPRAAKDILTKFELSSVPLYPYYRLGECLDTFYFDYVLDATRLIHTGTIVNDLLDFKVPSDKIVSLLDLDSPPSVDSLTKLMIHYKQNASKYRIFATGISYALDAIDINQFTLPTLNFARDSQDLYYDYKIARELLKAPNSGIRYALIGLAPYSFHWDVSSSPVGNGYLLQYFLYFRDLHNFHMSIDVYASLFRRSFIDGGFFRPVALNLNNVYMNKPVMRMNVTHRLKMLKAVNGWKDKFYPLSFEENKKILEDYLTLCDEHDVKPILFLPPNPQDYMDGYPKGPLDEFHVTLKRIMSRHSMAVFFNGWQAEGMTDADFSDSWHLNMFGAAKFSHMLNEFVMKSERK